MEKIPFASDNYTPVHPLIIEAISLANQGLSPPYGGDPWTEEATTLIQETFGRPCKVLLLPTGTGSNVLALKLACKSHASVLCSDIAHICYQESGAAEAIVGCKLIKVPSVGGKMTLADVRKTLARECAFGKHSTKPGILSITQPTEYGSLYSLKELAELSKLCREEKLILHMDGSRIYNAAAAMDVSLAEIAAGVDILSIGGTKTGLMYAEALVIFNPELQEGADHLQKQTLQLLSKMRFIAAQYIPFFRDHLWHTLANHANEKAQEVAAMIQEVPGLHLSYPVETNQLFITLPEKWIPLFEQKILCYLWDQEKHEIRLVTSWNTSEKEIEQMQAFLASLR
jgi:threonine aldolase